MLSRLSSSTSVAKVPVSPGHQSPATPSDTAPTDPLPKDSTAPHQILINRCHEVKRITKSLATYFEGLATAHHTHSLTLGKLSDPKVIQTPLQESSLFMPIPVAPAKGQSQAQGQSGWADLLVQIKETNKKVAEEHAELSKKVAKDVVLPLKKLRTDIKLHITSLEKEVLRLVDIVTKERDHSTLALVALGRGISAASGPLGLSTSGPSATLSPPLPAQDPFLLRSAAELQMITQMQKENELLKSILSWTEKTEQLEKEIFNKITACWKIWESSNSNALLGSQQLSMLLSANIDSLPADAEWSYFTKLNHVIPKDTPVRTTENLEYPGRDDPTAVPLKEGILERQKKFLKTWNSAFFVLTPSGNFHSYVNSSSPSANPVFSVALLNCTLGPMPPPPDGSTKAAQGKGSDAAMFTIESPSDGRMVFRAKSWEELGAWYELVNKFTKKAPLVVESDHDLGTPTGDGSEHAGDIGGALPQAVDENGTERNAVNGEPTSSSHSANGSQPLAHDQSGAIPSVDEAGDGDIGFSASSVPSNVGRSVPPPPPARSPAPRLPPLTSEEGSTNGGGLFSVPNFGSEGSTDSQDHANNLFDPPMTPPILTEAPESPPS